MVVKRYRKLSEQQLNALISRQNQLFLSLATLWKLSIKVNTGKLTTPQPLDKLVAKECPQDNIKIIDMILNPIGKSSLK